jgi:hypothetical protein
METPQLRYLIRKEIMSQHRSGGNIISTAFDKVKQVTFNTGSPQTDRILKKYGNWVIKRATIQRKPIDKILKDIMGFITNGEFNKHKYFHDDVFHLSATFEIEDPITHKRAFVLTEKRPNIFWTTESSLDREKDQLPLKLESFKPITLNQMIDETQTIMSNSFNTYNAKTNNCQHYILALFDAYFKLATGISMHQPVFKIIKDYIYQDLSRYISGGVGAATQVVTDLGHIFNRVVYGAAIKRKSYK